MKVSTNNYYVYIVTNQLRTTLYIGVTNDLLQRVIEHYLNRGNPVTFAGRYSCYWLIYYEEFKYINNAILREKELKGWTRDKKHRLIETMNPTWQSFNESLFEQWPPKQLFHRKDL